MNRALRLIGSVLAIDLTLTASTLLVTTGGTFASGTPASSWSAAGDTWTVSFDVSSMPSVSSSSLIVSYISFTNFVYALNRSPVDVGPVGIAFFNSSFGGLFDLYFFGTETGSVTGFSFTGPQAYTGSESAPTIVPGTYVEETATTEPIRIGPNDVYLSGVTFPQGVGSVQITSVPEPPGFIPLFTLLGLAFAWLGAHHRATKALERI
jgi:hypothetical protein